MLFLMQNVGMGLPVNVQIIYMIFILEKTHQLLGMTT